MAREGIFAILLPVDTLGGPVVRLSLAPIVVRPPPPDLEEGGWRLTLTPV